MSQSVSTADRHCHLADIKVPHSRPHDCNRVADAPSSLAKVDSTYNLTALDYELLDEVDPYATVRRLDLPYSKSQKAKDQTVPKDPVDEEEEEEEEEDCDPQSSASYSDYDHPMSEEWPEVFVCTDPKSRD